MACIFFVGLDEVFFIKKIQAEDISILIINELWGDLYLFFCEEMECFYKKKIQARYKPILNIN